VKVGAVDISIAAVVTQVDRKRVRLEPDTDVVTGFVIDFDLTDLVAESGLRMLEVGDRLLLNLTGGPSCLVDLDGVG
jgi:hypothetical protein